MLVAAAFLKRGIPVYQPVVDVGVDLVADFNGRMQRIQVKSTISTGRSIHVHLDRRAKSEASSWVRYDPGSLDWYAVCCLGHDYIALVPAGRAGLWLTFEEGKAGERLAALEINNVIDRLLEEKHD